MAASVAGSGVAPGRALRLAHRGDWRGNVENTLPAFLAALAVRGCDGLEFDVRAARGGVAVCYHDDTLTRVHGVDRRIDEMTPDELELLGVPTLEAVLTTISRSAFLDVELKGDPASVALSQRGQSGASPAIRSSAAGSNDETTARSRPGPRPAT
ncbi:MAG TPA: glycerophosphodiester phosphodiesterase family protein, partial [Candidatus Limnocylindrales bacterium]|nr:glycerophosphodiester phosphodiesterase family protein [Candidatus Limnocylindrales bacterium]